MANADGVATEATTRQLVAHALLAMITAEAQLDHALVEMKMIVTAVHLTIPPKLPLST